MEDLARVEDLSGLPGASTLPDVAVRAAAESVRDESGWHIAPVVSETVEVDVSCGVALLPSLRVVDIAEVRDARSGDAVTGWRVDKRAGVLHDLGARRRVVVDLSHGYDRCPAALLPLIAERAQAMTRGGYVRQESLGSRSVAMSPLDGGSALSRYKLPPRP